MRVLFVTTVAKTMEAFLLPLAKGMRQRGWTVDGAASGISRSAECKSAFDHTWEVKWSRNPLSLGNISGTLGQLQALVRQEGYDLVHVHTPIAAFVTRFALRRLPASIRPVVIYTAHGFHFHAGGGFLRNLIFLYAEKLAGRWTDYVVVINHEDEAAAKKHHIVRPERVRYMPGIGVDTSLFSPEPFPPDHAIRIRAELGIPHDARVFLMIAEFNPGKRHRDALEAFSLLRQAHPAYLLLAGDGPLLPRIRAHSESLGVLPWVRFLGFRADIASLIRASDVTLLPSEREGLPRSVMESLCLAVPVIGSNVRGIRDLVGHECGRLVELGNSKELAEAMAWMIENPRLRVEMGYAGRTRMQEYDVSKIIKLHDDLYAEAFSNKAGRRSRLVGR